MISVVIPIYNVEKYLRECLDSVKVQTLTDFEVVMVNDGSTDGSADIAGEYAKSDRRFRLLSISNGGASVARNAGIKAATGDFFVFLDADDAMHPRALEILSSVMQQYPQADMVMTDIRQTAKPAYSISGKFKLISGAEALRNMLYQKKGTHTNMAGRMIRRSVISKTGFFEAGMLYEDLDYCQRLYPKCTLIAVSRDIVNFYRITPGSATQRWSLRRLHALDVTDEIERRIAKTDPGDLKAAQSRRFSAHYNMFLLSLANGYADGADRCWPVIRALRVQMLLDGNVRLKNKAGALVACFGRRFTGLFAKKLAGK